MCGSPGTCVAACRYGDVDPMTQRRIMGKVHAGAQEYRQAGRGYFERLVGVEGSKRDAVRRAILQLAHIYGDDQPAPGGVLEFQLDPGITKGSLYYNDYLDLCDTNNDLPASYRCVSHRQLCPPVPSLSCPVHAVTSCTHGKMTLAGHLPCGGTMTSTGSR